MNHPWDVAHDEVQLATWRKALVATEGNIKKAAERLGIHRSHASRLTRKFELVEWAAELRVAAGGSRTGRPPDSRNAR